MGKVIIRGWSKPGDDIPQPTSIIMGKNLRGPTPKVPDLRMTDSEKPSEQASIPPAPEQPSKTPRYPVVSPDELRKYGVPIRNDLIISPTPRKR